ncbi:Breast cancer anti-estrogen resistance protein 3 [Bagarius yarrelli]|uniref:Breast cancer anti-estrogen resistance protein 3 n=1 Tax=Bagarius yarrelli TaxID=175774 RepID=A0A556VAE6_BAGYA|nr:Breast cancer anti-estrogen resistance protein 3 [Bagarius yarrelli]
MSNRSIAWWLRQIGLPQYTQTLEKEYYGLEVFSNRKDMESLKKELEEELKLSTDNVRSHAWYHGQLHREGAEELLKNDGDFLVRDSSTGGGDYVLSCMWKKQYIYTFLTQSGTRLILQPNPVHLHFSNSIWYTYTSPTQSGTPTLLLPNPVHLHFSYPIRYTYTFSNQDTYFSYPISHLLLLIQYTFLPNPLLLPNNTSLLLPNPVHLHFSYPIRYTYTSPTQSGTPTLLLPNPVHLHFSYPIRYTYTFPTQSGTPTLHHLGYSRELFQFENDQFDNIAALVRFHVGGRRAISQASGAVIAHPVTRTLPLRVINERHTARLSSTSSAAAPQSTADKGKRRSLSSTHTDMLQVNSYNLLRSGSQPANLETVGRPSLQSAQSDSNIRPAVPQNTPAQDPLSPVFRTGSDPLLSPSLTHSPGQLATGGCTLRGSDGQLHSRAPPKPIRVSALFMAKSPTIPQIKVNPASLYDELVPQVPQLMLPKGPAARLRAQEKWNSRARITETSFAFLEAQRDEDEQEADVKKEEKDRPTEIVRNGDDWLFHRPEIETTSSFRLDAFRSLLLPDNNRPLEQSVLHSLKELFVRTDANTIALHMLSVDCQVARVTGVTGEQKRMMGVNSGLELITLPHGSQLRQDLLERHHLLALGVAVDVLGCTGISQSEGVGAPQDYPVGSSTAVYCP